MSTVAELRARRAQYLAAEAKILEAQEYQVGHGVTARRNRRADLEQVREEIARLDAAIAIAEATGRDFGELLIERVARPAGMESAAFAPETSAFSCTASASLTTAPAGWAWRSMCSSFRTANAPSMLPAAVSTVTKSA